MIHYKELNHSILWTEYRRWNVNSPMRFGQYIVDKYIDPLCSDPTVFYEPNNGVAYTLLISRLNKMLEITS